MTLGQIGTELFTTDLPTLLGGLVLLAGILMLLVRAIAGPTTYDRILAMNSIGTKIALFVALLGFISKRPAFLDIALCYAILNFVGTIAILKFVRYRRLS